MTSLLSTNMACTMNTELNINLKRQFHEHTDEEIQNILEGKDKESTKKATDSALRAFHQYLDLKTLGNPDDLSKDELAQALYGFYLSVKPLKKQEETYSVQSFKCMRAGLSRYYRTKHGFDIIKGPKFVKANEMFRAMCVDSKKKGKGVHRSYPKISQIDMERISEYFNYDHMNHPDPKRLQRHMLFYIVYFFCHRGRENLYPMTQDTFTMMTEPDGTQYVIQTIDEADKNHGPDDYTPTNEGRMYGNEGKKISQTKYE